MNNLYNWGATLWMYFIRFVMVSTNLLLMFGFGAGEAARPENPGHTWWLTTVQNSNSRGPNTPFQPPPVPGTHMVVLRQRHNPHTQKITFLKFKKKALHSCRFPLSSVVGSSKRMPCRGQRTACRSQFSLLPCGWPGKSHLTDPTIGLLKNQKARPGWWLTSVIPALEKLRLGRGQPLLQTMGSGPPSGL